MPVLAAVLILSAFATTRVGLTRARQQRQAVSDHAASVLQRDWVQELRSR